MIGKNKGGVFKIETKNGFGLFHCINEEKNKGGVIRVFAKELKEIPSNLEEFVSSKEDFIASFPVNIALRRKIIEKISYYDYSSFEVPRYMIETHVIRGSFLGWFIVDTLTYKRQLVQKLEPEHYNLQENGMINDTLLIERIETRWNVKKWIDLIKEHYKLE